MKRKFLVLAMVILTFAFIFSGCSIQNNEQLQPIKYNIEIENVNNNLEISQQVEFNNPVENNNFYVDFNLYNQAFRKDAKFKPFNSEEKDKAYYDGEDFSEIKFKNVSLENHKCSYSIIGDDKNILRIKTNEKIEKNKRLKVLMDYDIKIPKCIARFGVTPNAINLANFYPSLCVFEEEKYYHCNYYRIGDVFYSEVANYNVNLTTDSKYKVASSGKLNNKLNNNGKTKYCYSANNIRDFALVLSEKFKILKNKFNGTDIYYYYFEDENANDTLKTIKQTINLFSNTFAKYPYKTYSVVITDFLQGGMEFSGLVYISSTSGTQQERTILHETAHQWWYSMVGSNAIEAPFLDEGLTDFSSIYYYYYFDKSKYNEYIQSALRQHASIPKRETNVLDRGLDTYSHDYDYYINCYLTGQIMYDFLLNLMGQKKFNNALSEYATKNAFKNVQFEELLNAFENNYRGSSRLINKWLKGEVYIS